MNFDIKAETDVKTALEPLEKAGTVCVDQPDYLQRMLALSSVPYSEEQWFYPEKSEEEAS